MELWIKIVTFMYLIFNGVRVFSCIPQIISIAKEESEVKTISLSTWGMLTMGGLTAALYSIVVRVDILVALMTTGNALGCIAVMGIVLYKRQKYGDGIFFFKKKEEWATDEDVTHLLDR